MKTLFDQIAWEETMRDTGAANFLRSAEKLMEKDAAAGTAACIKAMRSTTSRTGVLPFAQYLETRMQEDLSRPGRRHVALRYIKEMDMKVVAVITLRNIFDGIAHAVLLQNVAIEIGTDIETELKLTALEQFDQRRVEYTTKHLKTVNNKRRRRAVFNHAARKSENFEWEDWTPTTRLHVGQYLIDSAVAFTGILEMHTARYKKTRTTDGEALDTKVYTLTATDEFRKWLQDENEKFSLLRPAYYPTLIPPKPWDGAWGGGYYSKNIPELSIIKTRYKEYLQELDERIKAGDMDEVVNALNTMQNTAWAVNTKVLDVMRELFNRETSESVAGLPPRCRREIPRCPVCGGDMSQVSKKNPHPCLANNLEALKTWKAASADTHDYNARVMSKYLQHSTIMTMAEKLKDEEAFYYPYQMDFRGRVYAVPSGLTPQGTKASKGLLHFAKGKALGSEDALKWLMIHGANCWGEDKVDFAARQQWVLDNEDKILACAEDPIGFQWWTDADSPWCFLAFCFEWSGYKQHGLAFESRLPIAMDGSCNGIQIFSLILRDEEGGKAVNVLPSDKPQDIYQLVADRVTEKMKWYAEHGDAVYSTKQKDEKTGDPLFLYDQRTEAREWLKMGINRKATKRQVMVLPYGGTQQSCKDYTLEYLKGRIEDGYEWGTNAFRSTLFASGLIWESINEVVKAPQVAMKYLQKVASMVSKEGLPIYWITPTGLPVMQAYRATELCRIETKVGDVRLQLSVRAEAAEIDRIRQRNGISPNYIHSLDAAALQRTVCIARERGIDGFAMIHDSYGTHAADTPLLARTLREVFVQMFGGERNILDEFTQEVVKVLDEEALQELPPLPELGALEVSKVMEADFFFA